MMSTDEARSVIRSYLRSFNPFVNDHGNVPDFGIFAGQLEDIDKPLTAEILLEELQAEHPYERLHAAKMYLSGFATSEESYRAIEVFRDALESDSVELLDMAYRATIGLALIPSELLPFIEKHLDHHNPKVVQHALTVGVQLEETRLKCLRKLSEQIDEVEFNPGPAFEASIAMINSGFQSDRAWDVVIQLSNTIPKPDFFIGLVGLLSCIGSFSKVGFDFLLKAIEDPEIPKSTRNLLVYPLSQIATKNAKAKRKLASLLRSSEAFVVLATAENLMKSSEGVPPEGVKVLVGRLSHKSRSIRNACATALLRCCPPLSGPLVWEVVGRIGVERDIVILEKLATIASRSGAESIEPLLQLSQTTTRMRYWIATITLSSAGEEARDFLLKAIASNPSAETSRFFCFLLSSYRLSNDARLDEFKSIISFGTQDEATNLLVALSNAGKEAEFLTPVLLDAVVGEDAWRSDLSMKAVEGIGPIALTYFPPFEESHLDNERLALLRRKLEQRGLSSGGEELAWIDIRLLEAFILVASELEKHGRIGFKKIAENLEAKKIDGTIPESMAISGSKLRTVIRQIEDLLSSRWKRTVILIEKGDRKSGSLTDEGKRFVTIARRHVALHKL